MNNYDEVLIKLKDIFYKRFNIDLCSYGDDIFDKELFGSVLIMAPRDLIYLFFDIENEFNITIPQKFIVEGKFNTLNNIADIITQCTSKCNKSVV